MRRIAIVLVLMVSGCSYITPPLTNISGPDTQITKKEMVVQVPRAKYKRVKITIRPVGRVEQ